MASIYYIDYVGGSDSNNGTSKVTAWKKCPGMNGFGGSYSHVAGDQFIFKGGVTWPVSCFQLKVTWGGTSDGVRDWYTVDETWYSGSSYARPIFDFENTLIGTWGGWEDAAGVLFESTQYITVHGLELIRHRAPLEGVGGVHTWGSTAICLNTCNYITVDDCIGRDWDQPTPMVSGGSGGGFLMKINTGTGHVCSNCEIHQENSATKNGTGLWNIGTVSNCHIHHIGGSAIMSAQLVHDCHIHHIVNPDDPAAHGNVALCNGGLTAYNNLIHDTESSEMVFFINAGYYGAGGVDTLYNNLVYNVAQPCVSIDTDGVNDPSGITRIYNNTFVGDSAYCIRLGDRDNGPYGTLDYRNNHLIAGTPVSIEADVNHLTASYNLTQSLVQANAAGYTITNHFAPVTNSSATVNIGVDLSSVFTTDISGTVRPQLTLWDVGCWEYYSGSATTTTTTTTTPGPTTTTTSTTSTTSTSTTTTGTTTTSTTTTGTTTTSTTSTTTTGTTTTSTTTTTTPAPPVTPEPIIVDIIATTGSAELSGSHQKCIQMQEGCFARTFGNSSWNRIRLALRYRLVYSSSFYQTNYPNPYYAIGFCHGTDHIPGDTYVDHALCDRLKFDGYLQNNFEDRSIFITPYPSYATSASGWVYNSTDWNSEGTITERPQITTNTASSAVFFFDIFKGTTTNSYSASIWSYQSDYDTYGLTKYYHYTNEWFATDMVLATPTRTGYILRTKPLSEFTIDENASGSFDSVCVWWGLTNPVLQILDLYVIRFNE